MSKLDIVQLLRRHRTDLILDFESKKGPYAARLAVTTQGKIERSFASPYKCPLCGEEVSEYLWGVKCKNDKCNFGINRKICHYELNEEDKKALFSKKKTKPHHFINTKGKEFVALLYLDERGALKFEFPKSETAGKES